MVLWKKGRTSEQVREDRNTPQPTEYLSLRPPSGAKVYEKCSREKYRERATCRREDFKSKCGKGTTGLALWRGELKIAGRNFSKGKGRIG